MGLAIARQWVRLMGGDIAVHSTLGEGSVFSWSIEVPVAGAQAGATVMPPPDGNIAHWRPAPGRAMCWWWTTWQTTGRSCSTCCKRWACRCRRPAVVDAWITSHRSQLGAGPLARGVIALGDSLQLQPWRAG